MIREREYQVTFVHPPRLMALGIGAPKSFTVTSGTPAEAAARAVREHDVDGTHGDHVMVDVEHNGEVLRFEVIKAVTYVARPVALPWGALRR